jgi:hypothetical protein
MNAPVRHPVAPHLKALLDDLNLYDLVGHINPPGYPDRFGHYQYTHNGRIFFSCDPRAEEVHIDDVAKHLSRLCRFGGATNKFMSVAEHCWHCSQIVPEHEALEALLHDAAEAYVGDMIRPLKTLPGLGDLYLKVESGIERVVAERFDLVYPWPKSVKKADEFVVGAEVALNIRSKVSNHLSDDIDARMEGLKSDLQFYYWSSELAEAFFLQRFYELANKRLKAAA